MLFADDTIHEITCAVFESVLGLSVHPGDGTVDDSPRLVFSVDVHGAWSGSVHLDIGTTFAHSLAHRMFGDEPISEADVVDAMGELANVIGGNMKGLLPGPSSLSVPRSGGVIKVTAKEHRFTSNGNALRVAISDHPVPLESKP
jgi:chemotaxis protein CheX